MTQAQEKAPGGESKGLVNLAPTSVPNTPDIYPAHAGLVAGVHVAVVQVRGTGGDPKYRRHVYFGLAAAQRNIDRATAAGLDASIVLCHLIPAGGDQ